MTTNFKRARARAQSPFDLPTWENWPWMLSILLLTCLLGVVYWSTPSLTVVVRDADTGECLYVDNPKGPLTYNWTCSTLPDTFPVRQVFVSRQPLS